MAKKITRRPLTTEEKAWADRLMAIFQKRKDSHKISQVKLGDMIGISQSAVGQYLNGGIPLNLMAMISFSLALDCTIQDIDPNCPYKTPMTPEETALIEAYREMKKQNDTANHELLIFAASRSPAYQRAMQQTTKTPSALEKSSIEKQ